MEAEPGEFALYLMYETGERRIISETEFPLLVRVRYFLRSLCTNKVIMRHSLILVRTGPHEDVAKLYLMDRTRTEEISQQVAAFLRLCRLTLDSLVLPDYS